jgi:hypothetical protein
MGEIVESMERGFVARSELPALIGKGLEIAEQRVLDDNVLDETEERRVLGFIDSIEDVWKEVPGLDRIRRRLVSAAVIRLVLEGKNPASRQAGVSLQGFRFLKSEMPVWAFDAVDYEVLRDRVHYAGSSRGFSFRVARGVYMRTGGFRGERHVVEERAQADSGRLVITTKHLYFAGETHRFRIQHERVASYEPLPDGFAVTRDRANARPERFRGMDGWFAYNLLMNAEDLV